MVAANCSAIIDGTGIKVNLGEQRQKSGETGTGIPGVCI